MKAIRLLFLVMALCLASGVKAQFYSSESVYCYQYVKTINDGISSKLNRTMFYFVNFQNEMMGYTTASSLKYVRQKLLENPDYYSDRAINNLAENYNKWKTQPSLNGSAYNSVTLIKYCSDYSTSSKYTYRTASAHAQAHFQPGMFGGGYATWGSLSWGSKCYSFSRDRSELIIWTTSDSENRDYYKLIDANSLKPNTDFLE